jgi:hypothetical protein
LLLQGNLKEFSLPNIFQLVKMSAKTGALTIRREDEWGKIFFRNGLIYYAFSVPTLLPLGERLVKAGAITGDQLKDALAEQKKKGAKGGRLGAILLGKGLLERETLEQAVREQIEDATFNFFSWVDGEFEFGADEEITDEDIVVELNVENVIMEGCRRIDEWELIFEQLGSLERVPHLGCTEGVEERGEVRLTVQEWRVVSHIDGRADINTVLKECGLDRFHGAKVIYGLYSRGLITVSEPMLEGIGQGLSVAVRGPIDLYNEVFLTTLTDANLVKQLRVELIDDIEVEIPVVAGTLPAENGARQMVVEEGAAPPEDVLVFTAAASAPEEGWRRLAGESSAWVLLANANDDDSLRATRSDLEFVRSLGDVPLVVATYVSMAEDAVAVKQVKQLLALDGKVPVVPCQLRDRDSVTGVVRAALELVGN